LILTSFLSYPDSEHFNHGDNCKHYANNGGDHKESFFACAKNTIVSRIAKSVSCISHELNYLLNNTGAIDGIRFCKTVEDNYNANEIAAEVRYS
jgi:hypothetical protein